MTREECKINHEIMWGNIVDNINKPITKHLFSYKVALLKKSRVFTVATDDITNCCFLCQFYLDMNEEDFCIKCPLNSVTDEGSGCFHYAQLTKCNDPSTRLTLATHIRDILK